MLMAESMSRQATVPSYVSPAHPLHIDIRHTLNDFELEDYVKREKANGSRNIQIKLITPASSLSRT
jgi:hypothetical protein